MTTWGILFRRDGIFRRTAYWLAVAFDAQADAELVAGLLHRHFPDGGIYTVEDVGGPFALRAMRSRQAGAGRRANVERDRLAGALTEAIRLTPATV